MAQLRKQPLSDGAPWESTLCFTGHRPEKLPQGAQLDALLKTLYYYIDHAVNLGFTHFYTGLADGIDYYAAEYLFCLRKDNPRLHVIGVQPCNDYREFFHVRGYSLERLDMMLNNVDVLRILDGTYHDYHSFYRRNQYMVNRSSGIIAVFQQCRSGSASTLQYAREKGLAYCHIEAKLKQTAPPYPGPGEWPVEQSGF